MKTLWLSTAMAALLTTPAWSQENRSAAEPTGAAQPGVKVEVERAYRASQLIGMDVRNSNGQNLGNVNDVVFDLDTGRVRYVAISFGGFLGIGNKLFAVPIDLLKLKHGTDESCFVFDVAKDRLQTAPGFNQDAWPDMADRKWRDEVDAFYAGDLQAQSAASAHTGKVVRTTSDRLIMTGEDGTQHAHIIGSNVTITVDGRPAKLSDLQPGQEVTVATVERNEARIVTAIKANSLRR